MGRGVTMAALVRALANHVEAGRQITDRTGLSGAFDFTLEWTSDPPTGVVAQSHANFLAALEQQLGLVIVPAFAAEPALIVDGLELPFLD